MGPKSIAATVITASFKSKERNPALKWKSTQQTYASAEKTPTATNVRTLVERLKLVHLHDNDGRHDKHFQPFKGVIDWDAVCVAFKEVGYSGNFSLELKPAAGATKEYAEEAFASAKRLYELFLSK